MDYILLGLLQGATEFLPVSSSGHLVAAQKFLSVKAPELFLGVCLHFGTLVAILIVFRREVLGLIADGLKGAYLLLRRSPREEIARRAPLFNMALAIALGTLPAALVGVCCRDAIRGLFEGNLHLRVSGGLIMVTGIVLFAGRYAPAGHARAVGPFRGLLVGMAQAAALLPGLSRSGLTIVAGYFLGLERGLAARFSFLLAVPALVGAMVLEVAWLLLGKSSGIAGEETALVGGEIVGLLCGTALAAVVGTVCLILLLRVIQRGKLHWFAAYCVPAGALLVALSFLA